jgi:hypothetical protein
MNAAAQPNLKNITIEDILIFFSTNKLKRHQEALMEVINRYENKIS